MSASSKDSKNPGTPKTGDTSEIIRQTKAITGGEIWRNSAGDPLSCTEKIKVLNENLHEIKQLSQDALEDAILMGCDEQQFRQVIQDLFASLKNPYADT